MKDKETMNLESLKSRHQNSDLMRTKLRRTFKDRRLLVNNNGVQNIIDQYNALQNAYWVS
jgi:hypothetical protein